jgi:NADH dehydrogenase (ubiquinone) 1 beta subcomplex subunit 4
MHDIYFVSQFDSGVQRFMSMRATEYDHFKPTPRTSLYGLFVIVIPMIAFGYWVKTTRVRYSHYSQY